MSGHRKIDIPRGVGAQLGGRTPARPRKFFSRVPPRSFRVEEKFATELARGRACVGPALCPAAIIEPPDLALPQGKSDRMDPQMAGSTPPWASAGLGSHRPTPRLISVGEMARRRHRCAAVGAALELSSGSDPVL